MAALGYLISPIIQVEDINGKPLVGGRVRVYRHGTQIPYITHKNWSGDLNPAEVRLDARGMCILIAEDDNLYDIYCEDANYVEQWSRLNVAVGGAGGGSGTTSITSSDGTVTVITANGVTDLSVPGSIPSAIIVQSESRTGNGPFIFTSNPINITGSDIALVGSRISCKKRWYHYDATVMLDWQGIPQNSIAELTISAPDCFERVAFDLSYNHAEWVTISADYEIQANGDNISFGISGMPDSGMHAQLYNVSVHSIVGRVNTAGTEYTAGPNITISPSNVISTEKVVLNAGANISINSSSDPSTRTITYTINSNGGGSASYSGGEAIDIDGNDAINVKYGDGLGLNASNELEVKLGDGLEIAEDGGVKVITIDSDVSDVVTAVKKLERDLDSQLAVSYDIANVTGTSDFSTYLTNGATMICQAFAVAINHGIRTDAENDPTQLGIYFKNSSYSTPFILALYVFDFETGYTDYVGDTGPVKIYQQGLNQFPLKNKNPNINELVSSKIYYASIYLPSTRNNGLFLASCPAYDATINARPRFTVGVENILYNGSEIDLTDPTAQLGYNDGNGNYYIGPWSDGYNERPTIPRFFMQIRNGSGVVPVITDPFVDIGTFSMALSSGSVADIFGDTTSIGSPTYAMIYREVTPLEDVDIAAWELRDQNPTVIQNYGTIVYSSDFSTNINSGNTPTITELGEIESGIYGHKYTLSTPIHLTAGTTYRFPVAMVSAYTDKLAVYTSPIVQSTLHLFASVYNISNWVPYVRVNNTTSTLYIKLYDNNSNHYVI